MSSKDAAAEYQAAEREATAIRNALKKLGTEGAIEETNSLTLEWKEVCGLAKNENGTMVDCTHAVFRQRESFLLTFNRCMCNCHHQ